MKWAGGLDSMHPTWEYFRAFIVDNIQVIPSWMYWAATLAFFGGSVLLWVIGGKAKGGVYAARLFSLLYIVLLFCTTVIFRETHPAPEYQFHPFWHYRDIRQGVNVEVLLPDVVLNVLVFIPVGLALCLSFKKRRWLVPLIGCGLSFTIELLQFLFLKGCTDVDDVIHNTLGCLIGCGVCLVVEKVNKLKRGVTR